MKASRHSRGLRVTLIAAVAASLALLVVSARQPPIGLRVHARSSPAAFESITGRTAEINTTGVDRLTRRMHTSDALVQWSGYLYARTTGEYAFRVYAAGKAELWIDGRSLLQTNGADVILLVESTVHLTEGSHRIDVQLTQQNRPSAFELRWREPSGHFQTLSARVL